MEGSLDSVAEVFEVAVWIDPIEGVSIYDALQDANLTGYDLIEVDRANNRAKVTVFRREGV